ncbi:MAG TPA: site-specific DNA-methyltransferase [Clostridiales bacterium]|nr:site-specific DNA-methyltransferase [Clostridiales bacterium]
MMSMDNVQMNVEKIQKLFPNAVTEVLRDGKPTLAIDFDVLKQELSAELIDDKEERYQMTWPDKKKSILLANTPISATLRPCKEESVDFDHTQNLYIEGDNLDVLKLLQETYLGKIKMIYIDPPYNTGNDFVYNDDFAMDSDEYADTSGQYDEQGNRLFQNTESNGRFHTDWLNMIYPRLKVAKDLLADDGVIFIHIDENEVYTLQVICNEIFGANNELGTIIWDKRNPKGAVVGVAYQHESILVYCKDKNAFATVPFIKEKEHARMMIEKVAFLIKKYGGVNNIVREEYKNWLKEHKKEFSGGEIAYNLIDDNGSIYRIVSMAAPDKPETRSHRPLIHPITQKPCAVSANGWRFTDATMDALVLSNRIEFGIDETTVPNQKYYLKDNMFEAFSSLLYFGGSDDAMGLPFDNPKPIYVAKKIIKSISDNCLTVLDFFSGAATTAHAVMQLNAEDGGNRKYIMVQLPEKCDEKSEAYKAGYKTICDIGKERIRRAGKKILQESGVCRVESGVDDNSTLHTSNSTLDIGFRVLKLDSSNMKDVYYKPSDYSQGFLGQLEDNIKADRTPLDLLFQVMLDLGKPLSAKIEEREIAGKHVFVVDDNDLVACFDSNVTEDVVKTIAQLKPLYAVFRDSGLSSDSVGANFDQIFATYSPNTTRKVL